MNKSVANRKEVSLSHATRVRFLLSWDTATRRDGYRNFISSLELREFFTLCPIPDNY